MIHRLKDFLTLTKGDVISLDVFGEYVPFTILTVESDTGPCEVISTLDTDLTLEIVPPLDVEPAALAGQVSEYTGKDSLADAPVVFTSASGFEYYCDIEALQLRKEGEAPSPAPVSSPFVVRITSLMSCMCGQPLIIINTQ